MKHRSEGRPIYHVILEGGIDSSVLRDLREDLSSLDILESDDKLRKFFLDKSRPNLNDWANELRVAGNVKDRVDSLISLLHTRRNIDYGNALLIFLEYLENQWGFDFSYVWVYVAEQMKNSKQK